MSNEKNPQSGLSRSRGNDSQSVPAVTVNDLAQALGINTDDDVCLSMMSDQTEWRDFIVRADAVDVIVGQRLGDDDAASLSAYVGWNGFRQSRKVADLYQWRVLVADLDVKDGGLPDLESCRDVIDDLSVMLNTAPAAIIYSGHGLQPIWSFERDDWSVTDDDRADAVALSKRFGRLVDVAATARGGAADNVSDLARVIRCPGSVNNKDKDKPIPVRVEITGGAPITRQQLTEALDAHGVAERDDDRGHSDRIIKQSADWRWGDVTTAYVAAMVKGWADDTPRGSRHNWLVNQFVRLECAHRAERITQDDHRDAVIVLEKKLRSMREPTPRSEIPDAITWAIDLVSRKPLADVYDEVGGAPAVINTASPVTIEQCRDVYRRWFGEGYDLDVLDVVLAVAAGNQLTGDPCWLLVVGGSGSAKTETIAPLAAAGAYLTSSISSEGALLSGTPTKQVGKTATGGLLREMGDAGLLILKDVTTILSMSRETRGSVLAALREIYDGRWERSMGVDGGKRLHWDGRIIVIGGVTTAWDAAHKVVATMGDRFVLVRFDSTINRRESGRQALANTGDEVRMREALGQAVAGVLVNVNREVPTPSDDVVDEVLAFADLVTLMRSAVERDYSGEPDFVHDPESPTRFAKQLLQIWRGAIAIGIAPDRAMSLVARCAGDSVPPFRLSIVSDIFAHPGSTSRECASRNNMPVRSVARALSELQCLDLLTTGSDANRSAFLYYMHAQVDADRLGKLVGRNVSTADSTNAGSALIGWSVSSDIPLRGNFKLWHTPAFVATVHRSRSATGQ